MTQRSEDIRRKLKELSVGDEQVFLATVKEVNQDEFTCMIETSTDIQYIDVRLRAVIDPEKKGFCFIPKLDSLVLVGRIGNSNELYVVLFSEIDKIIFNYLEDAEITFDAQRIFLRIKERSIEMTEEAITFNAGDKNSFATDINKLVEKMNALEQDLNDLKAVFLNTWIPAPMDGGAALKMASATWAGKSFVKTEVDDLKDELIKH